jgi:predicted DsbA family dithiol-disulfide isomerase
MTKVAADEGLEFRFDRALTVSTLSAHSLLLLALQEHGPRLQAELATLLYDAQFRDGVNIADRAELTRIAGRAGMGEAQVTDFLAADKGRDSVREEAAAAHGKGITAAPTFAFPGGELLRGASETADLVAALRRARD